MPERFQQVEKCPEEEKSLFIANTNTNTARIANAAMNVDIVVLNGQRCNQCLKGHKSLGLLFEGVH